MMLFGAVLIGVGILALYLAAHTHHRNNNDQPTKGNKQ